MRRRIQSPKVARARRSLLSNHGGQYVSSTHAFLIAGAFANSYNTILKDQLRELWDMQRAKSHLDHSLVDILLIVYGLA